MSARTSLLLVAASILFAEGCGISGDRITGSYSAEHDGMVENLVLARDGSFTQTVRSKTGDLSCATQGSWRLVEDAHVELQGIIVLWNGPARPECPEGSAATLPAGRFVRTSLEVPDHFVYWKQ